jgi:hypothetical protein
LAGTSIPGVDIGTVLQIRDRALHLLGIGGKTRREEIFIGRILSVSADPWAKTGT